MTPPLEGAIARGDTVRSFTYPNVIGQSILNVNDPSQMDMRNQTCFICRADYPSGNIARSDPLCVDVAGTMILDLSVIVCKNTTKMVVVGSIQWYIGTKMPLLTRSHVHIQSHSVVLKGLKGKVCCFGQNAY